MNLLFWHLPNAFIPAVPCAVARSGIALLLLKHELSFSFLSLDVTGPLELSFTLLGRSASKVMLILHSNLAFNLVIMSISCK